MSADSNAATGDPFRSRDARPRVIVAGSFILLIVLTPPRYWPLYLLQAGVLFALYLRFPQAWPTLRARWFAVGPFLLLLAFGIPLSRGLASGWDLMAAALARAMLALAVVVLLVATTPAPELWNALARLGTPNILVAVLALLARYREVLVDELTRMRRAKQSRTFRSSSIMEWRILSRFVGILFLRGLARAERVHEAMLARGWSGEWGSARSLSGREGEDTRGPTP